MGFFYVKPLLSHKLKHDNCLFLYAIKAMVRITIIDMKTNPAVGWC